ncbi:uncharacterized protein LOC126903952 [Daktulosphaira vitifoliae]|uniref:uncharacterized protein LOC126903952 n=1 Tax=Daktulosphaira vitifoliae TaxID=58002 RepID=UPI0021AA3BEF|nr:uncharacterized protein LOC126903952 [Daktulosphaira vitifoliae]
MFLSSRLLLIIFTYNFSTIIHSSSNDTLSQYSHTENISQTTQLNNDFFYPVDTAWQLKLCEKLEFSFKHKSSMNNKIIPLDVPMVNRKIPGHGNCFFNAVSYWITGSTIYGVRLRNQVLDYMEMQTTFLTNKEDYFRRIKKMRNPDKYAESDEIHATAAFLETSIYVFSEKISHKWVFFSRNGLDGKRIKEPCIYLHLSGLDNTGHYTITTDVDSVEVFRRHFIPVSPEWQDMKTKEFFPSRKYVKKNLFKNDIVTFLHKNQLKIDYPSQNYKNSFYKSLSYCINGDKQFYKTIQHLIYEFMHESRSVAMLLKNSETRHNYIANLYIIKKDAETPEIFAAAELLKTSIYIYNWDDGDWDFVSKNGPEGVEEIEPCIYLAYGVYKNPVYSVVRKVLDD